MPGRRGSPCGRRPSPARPAPTSARAPSFVAAHDAGWGTEADVREPVGTCRDPRGATHPPADLGVVPTPGRPPGSLRASRVLAGGPGAASGQARLSRTPEGWDDLAWTVREHGVGPARLAPRDRSRVVHRPD